jgi:hypothetical protein
LTFDWKLPAIVAAGCFILSALTGAIAGVQFWAVVLRAFLLALAGGLAAFGLRALAGRFLPGIGEDDVPGDEEAERPETGRNVDLRVGGGEADFADGAAAPEGPEDPAGSEGADGAVGARGDFEDDIEELKTEPILASKGEGDGYDAVRPLDILDDVDVLPDLDAFSESFAPPRMDASEGGQAEEPPPIPSRRSGGADPGQGEDSGTLAQAVRTMLIREKKG